ncbi:MAG: ferrous iron transporter A [Candidatus Dasytiphilus stammeri]
MNFIPDQIYKIVGFSSETSVFYRHRLLTIGMLPGSIFQIIRIAPLGDPIQIKIRDLNLSLRKKDLAYFQLEIIK